MPLLLLKRFWPLLALIAFIIIVKFAIDEYNDAQRGAAKSEQVVQQQGKVIENAVQANEARKKVLDPTELYSYCQCLRTARTNTSCERYLPNDAANIDKPASLCPKP